MGLLIFVACKRQDLVYEFDSVTRVTVHVDWGDIFSSEDRPTGVSVWFYPKGDQKPIQKLSSNIDSVKVYLAEGKYDVVVFNQAPSDFRDELEFLGTDKLSTLEVRASLATTKNWYSEKLNEDVYEIPPVFATTVYRDFVITKDDCEKKRELSIRVRPEKITQSARVIVNMEGVEYIRSGRGIVSNMSQGYMFDKGETCCASNSLLEKWNTEGAENEGMLFTHFNTFGIPSIEAQDATGWDSELKIQVLLVDNHTVKEMDLSIDESNLVDFDEDIDIEIEIDIISPVPPVEPEGGSGFEPSVDGWGDEDNVELINKL